MLVVLLTRLLMKLIEQSKKALDKQNDIYIKALQQFVRIAQEFLLEPVISMNRE